MMFRVTLKLKVTNGEWVDGPTIILDADEVEAYTQSHQFCKIQNATQEDIIMYGQRMPSAFKGFLK